MTIKSAVPLKTTLMIGNIIAAVGFFIYFIPYQGSQITAYSLFILYSLINAFAIERMVSLRNRGKGKNVGKLFLSVLANLTPALFLILQLVLVIWLWSTHSDIVKSKDASGNLPPVLTTYDHSVFAFLIAQLVALQVYTKRYVRGGLHPSEVLRYVEEAIPPAFITLGSLCLFFIGLLYTVITRFLTDG